MNTDQGSLLDRRRICLNRLVVTTEPTTAQDKSRTTRDCMIFSIAMKLNSNTPSSTPLPRPLWVPSTEELGPSKSRLLYANYRKWLAV